MCRNAPPSNSKKQSADDAATVEGPASDDAASVDLRVIQVFGIRRADAAGMKVCRRNAAMRDA